jgi:riboflavin biosynthesis pyrimidine reductase
VLRDEPGVTHAFPTAPELAEQLAAWRRERLHKRAPPLAVVLSTGRQLDLDHPLFRSGAPAAVYTSRAGAERLRAAARERGVQVVARARPGLRDAIAHLRDERGAATIVVEAGPSSASRLYAAPLAVDELMLSVFEEPRVPEGVAGGPLFDEPLLKRLFEAASPVCECTEPSGRWSFRRLRARRR